MSMPSGWCRRGAALALAAALGSATFVGAWSGTRSGAAPHHPAGAQLSLLGQTEWVIPASPGTPSPFTIDLAARTAPAGAQVSTQVYPRLHTRDDFESWVRSGAHGTALAQVGPQTLTSLAPDSQTTGGSQLTLQVATSATPGATPGATSDATPGATPGATSSTTASAVDLACAPPTGVGTCTGVYPVEVSLLSASGTVLSKLTTFLTYQAAASTHPLELALILKLSAPVSISAAPPRVSTIRPLDGRSAAGLVGMVSALHANPDVPVTLNTSPQTLLSLNSSGAAGRATVSELATMSGDRPGTEVLQSPFVPVNLGALAGAGQHATIAAEMGAGSTTLHQLHVLTAGGIGTWVVTGPTGQDLAGGLASVGASQVVVPGADLTSTTLAPATAEVHNTGTWTSTFGLRTNRTGSGSLRAAVTDTFLSKQLARVGQDPALAVSQVLADLSMVHFERPNTPARRGLVAAAPDAANADPAFYRDLLSALARDPNVTPVTISQFFATVTPRGSRELAQSAQGHRIGPALVRAASSARSALQEFDASVKGQPPVLSRLGHDLLAAQAASLGAHHQAMGIAAFRQVLADQLRLVSIGTANAFTLTARTGWIPVTIDSRAPYKLVGTLRVNGEKFIFPHASSHTMHLDHATNLWRVEVEVRSSGDLPLHAVFTSPDGRLVIAQGILTVRSTATSAVGIALSALALVILLTWWTRTWWAGRKRRRRLRSASPEQ